MLIARCTVATYIYVSNNTVCDRLKSSIEGEIEYTERLEQRAMLPSTHIRPSWCHIPYEYGSSPEEVEYVSEDLGGMLVRGILSHKQTEEEIRRGRGAERT